MNVSVLGLCGGCVGFAFWLHGVRATRYIYSWKLNLACVALDTRKASGPFGRLRLGLST